MKNRRGFTLIEVIIAIVLISIVGLILGISMKNMIKKNTNREYVRFVDNIKSGANTYVALNRDTIEELYQNKSYIYIKVDELIKSGFVDETLKNPYTEEVVNPDELVKVNIDAISNTLVFTYPINDVNEELTLIALADTLDDESVFNCMDGAGTYKLAISKEDGTLIHLADQNGNLEGNIIKRYDINCKVPKEFTEASGSRNAVADGSTYRTFKNYKGKEGTYNVEYSWKTDDGKIHKITRVVSIKGKFFEAKFDGNKGTPSVGYIKVMHDAPYGTLATASRSGYIFGGWYYSGNNILPETKVYATETHTLKAKWMKKPTITTQGYHKSGVSMNASNGYVYKDVATVTFNGPEDNDDTIYYYVYSGSNAVSSASAYSCGTANTPGNCSTNGSTTINANTWYKVGSATKAGETKVTISYETQNDSNVTLKTYVTNKENFGGAGAQATIKKIDRTAPINCKVVPSGTTGKNNYYRSDITLTASGSDAETGMYTKTVDIAKITTDTKGTKVTATLVDKAGNSITCNDTFKRDVTAPVCYNDSYSNWTKDSRNITWGCGSDATSGCVKKEYGKNTYTTTTNTVNIAAYTIEDNAGNTKNCPATVANVKVDTTKPTCPTPTGQNTSWRNTTITVSYGCNDDHSGCNSSYNGGTKSYSTGVVTTDKITYTIRDNVGNETTCTPTVSVYVDFNKPTCSSSGGNDAWTNGSRTLTGTCNDNNESGCTGNASKKYDSEGNWTNQSPGRVYDNAGNYVDCPANQTVRIDRTKPNCTSTGGSTLWTNGSRTLIGTCTDTGTYKSGCTGNVSKKYDSEGAWTNQSPGRVYDNAGNYKDCPANQTVRIDRTAPSCSSSGGSTSWTSGNTTLTGTCTENGTYQSGCTGNASNTFTSEGTWTNQSPGRVYDNAGNYKDCPANQTVKQDHTKPVHTNWWWGEVTKDIARLYIQTSDGSSGINRVQCPTSTESGGYNNWYWFNAAWDSAANAYRCDITPSTFNHYGQIYKTHLYIYDNVGLGGYYNETATIIPSKCTLTAGQSWEFNYTGGEQSFTAECNGSYKLEVYGAQGGNAPHTVYSWATLEGGKGGYSVGTYKMNAGTVLNVVVGGQAAFASKTNNTLSAGGYNGGGGGATHGAYSRIWYGSGGGGATHIATAKGVLSSLVNNKSSVLIVAGGGGGSIADSGGDGGGGWYPAGVNEGYGGGGLTGGQPSAEDFNTDLGKSSGYGGTQTEGGKNTIYIYCTDCFVPSGFGQGAYVLNNYKVDNITVPYNGSAGGGGGWYGGGLSLNYRGGPGGSGYLNPSLTSSSMQTGVRSGNGYAKITFLGE